MAARKIKLSQVLSQVDDTEIDVLTEPQLVGMYARYEHLFGKGQRPHPSREPSVEQLTAIHGLIRSDQNPYVDFAIFGPFATRLKKRLKFQGLTLSKDGELISDRASWSSELCYMEGIIRGLLQCLDHGRCGGPRFCLRLPESY